MSSWVWRWKFIGWTVGDGVLASCAKMIDGNGTWEPLLGTRLFILTKKAKKNGN